eukprot:14365740-Alexandrium_andersonii.AAC.1
MASCIAPELLDCSPPDLKLVPPGLRVTCSRACFQTSGRLAYARTPAPASESTPSSSGRSTPEPP